MDGLGMTQEGRD